MKMDSRLLETFTTAILQNHQLRIWDGWKIRIPINTVGLFTATQHLAAERSESYSLEVGFTTKSKVNLTLLYEPLFRYTTQIHKAFDNTAKDGDVVVLAPITWVTSPILGTLGDRPRPDIFVLPKRIEDRSLAWFVWSRERNGSWDFLIIKEE